MGNFQMLYYSIFFPGSNKNSLLGSWVFPLVPQTNECVAHTKRVNIEQLSPQPPAVYFRPRVPARTRAMRVLRIVILLYVSELGWYPSTGSIFLELEDFQHLNIG
ncbi:hypothetical protein SLA2020_071170 [Shorea laevis]